MVSAGLASGCAAGTSMWSSTWRPARRSGAREFRPESRANPLGNLHGLITNIRNGRALPQTASRHWTKGPKRRRAIAISPNHPKLGGRVQSHPKRVDLRYALGEDAADQRVLRLRYVGDACCIDHSLHAEPQ